MSFRFTSIFILVLLTTTVGYSQTRKKKVVKPKPIRATVTVKADGPPLKPLPKETDEGIWQKFFSKEDDLEILFPGSKDDILDDPVGHVRTFKASTEKATYMLAVGEVGSSLDSRNNDEFLEDAIEGFVGTQTKLINKKNIGYEGYSGKQIVAEVKGKRLAARLYVLNGKLFIIMVSIKSTDYNKDFDKWIDKFLDSFKVRVPNKDA